MFDEVADPYLRERKGDVGRPGRAPEDEPARRTARRATCCASSKKPLGADRRRADAVADRPGRLDAVAAASPPMPAAARITPRSWPARSRCPRSSGLHDASRCWRRARWSRSTAPPARCSSTRIRRRWRGSRSRQQRRAASSSRRGIPRAGPGHRRRRRDPPRGQHRVRRRRGARALAGAEGIGLYRSEFLLAGGRPGRAHRGAAIPVLSPRARGHGAGAGHGADVRRRARRSSGSTTSDVDGGAGAARAARHPPQPPARRALPDAAARAAARGRARPAAHHVPVRLRGRGGSRARAPRSSAPPSRCAGAASRCRRCRSG